LSGRIVNVGSGTDNRSYGRRVVRVDAFAPGATVRADLDRPLPFASQAFDGAVCTEVLEHVRDSRRLLSEIARVLKPGAPLLITVPFVYHYHPDPLDCLRLTPFGLGEELKRAGFDVELVGGIGGRLMSCWLMVESLNPVLKAAMRMVALPLQPMIFTRRPVNGVWSPWAVHGVAIGRRRRESASPPVGAVA
jgi:SAM-dependent methyltransferase